MHFSTVDVWNGNIHLADKNQKSCDLCCPYSWVPTSGCFLKILSAALRYLTEKIHFTRLMLVHLFSISHLKDEEPAQKPVEWEMEEEEREEP